LSVESVKAKMAEFLNSLREHELRNCFEQWQQSLQISVTSEGIYVEGDFS